MVKNIREYIASLGIITIYASEEELEADILISLEMHDKIGGFADYNYPDYIIALTCPDRYTRRRRAGRADNVGRV